MMHRNERKGIAQAVRNLFAGGEQLALPKLDLISDAKTTLDSVLGHTSCALIELLLARLGRGVGWPQDPGAP